jgi:hypothetical protein
VGFSMPYNSIEQDGYENLQFATPSPQFGAFNEPAIWAVAVIGVRPCTCFKA